MRARQNIFNLHERFNNRCNFIGRDTDAVVGNDNRKFAIFMKGEINRYLPAVFGKFNGIGQNIQKDLPH